MKPKVLFKILIWFVSLLLILVAGFALYNHVSGVRSWNRVLEDLRDQGEPTEFSDFLPEPLDPNTQYFAQHPVLQAQLHFEINESGELIFEDPELQAKIAETGEAILSNPDHTKAFGNRGRLETTDYKRLAQTIDADTSERGSLEALKDRMAISNPLFEELVNSARLPSGHLAGRYRQPNLTDLKVPHLAQGIALARLSRFRSVVHLGLNEPQMASDDLCVAFRFVEMIGHEPSLLAEMVRITITQTLVTSIWEGLALEKWDEPQLEQLERELSRLNLRESLIFTLQADALAVCHILDEMVSGSGEDLEIEEGRTLSKRLFLIPGVLPHNKANLLRTTDQFFLQPLRDHDWTKLKDHPLPGQLTSENQSNLNWLMPRISLPAGPNVLKRGLRTEVFVRVCRIAIALERYKLANRSYPTVLKDVAPEFLTELPIDWLSGKPFIYEPGYGGRYRLYSVGWNLADDGGESVRKQSGSLDWDQGDWVWTYP